MTDAWHAVQHSPPRPGMIRAWSKRPEESLSGSWLSSRLGVGTQRLDAMRRAGELLGVRRPGGHDYLYPAWQFAPDGKPLPVVHRLVATGRGAGMSDERLYEVLDESCRALRRRPDRLADALRDGRTTTSLGSFARRLGHGPVSLNAVRKSFGTRTVLDGLDFAIEPQARVGIVGANGSGKSTLLRLIAGLEEPDAGTAVRRRGLIVSFLPQHPLGDSGLPSRPCWRHDPTWPSSTASCTASPTSSGRRISQQTSRRWRACSAVRKSCSSAGRRSAARASTAGHGRRCSMSGSRRPISRCRRPHSRAGNGS